MIAQSPQIEHTVDVSTVERREETRRSLLAKAGLVAGGVGLATVARPQEALAATRDELMFEGYNNVKDVPPGGSTGAAADGTTDDTAAIQAWLNASKRGGAKPGTVYFPPGTYGTRDALLVPAGSVLAGHGPHTVLKKLDTPSFGSLLKNEDGGEDIRIENLTLDGNRAERADPSNGSGNLIQLAGGASNILIRGVEGRECCRGFAFALGGAKKVVVENCYIHDCDKDGINVAGGEDVVIQGNLVDDCGDDHIAAGGSRITITGNVVNATSTSYGAPIALRGSAGVSIVGNVLRGGAQAAIVVQATSNIEIADNAIIEPGVTSATNGTPRPQPPTPNPVRGLGEGSGIAIFPIGSALPPLSRINVRSNVITSPFGHGIKLTANVNARPITDVALSGNLIHVDPGTGSGIACINMSKEITDVRVTDNDIRDAAGPGIEVTGANAKRWDIRGNRVVDSGRGGSPKPGIKVDSASDVNVTDNRCYDSGASGRSQSYGLTLANVAGHVLVTNNDFANNETGAISSSGTNPTTHIFENVGDDLA